MGKRAREQRREVQRARRAARGAADVADRAERGLDRMIEAIGDVAAIQGQRIRDFDVGGFDRLRRDFLDRGYRWPSWCYLPLPLVGLGLGEKVALDLNSSQMSPAAVLASLVAAWLPGRIAVRFDDDLAAALMATPLEGAIPVELLQRLPGWGLYIDCPQLGSGAGFFVAIEAGRIQLAGGWTSEEVDELFVAVIRDRGEPRPVLFTSCVWLRPGGSIADSLAEQERRAIDHGRGALESEEHWAEAFGMPRADAMARLVALVLYLCSTGADTDRSPLRADLRPAHRRAAVPVTVMSAGFRVGAALRLASPPRAGGEGDETGRRVAPHLRRAHWHSYWCGSESRGDRRLELRWVPPVPVNADLSEKLLTVVRPAGRPEG